MKFPDLKEKEKNLVKEICKSCPEYLKEYWGINKLPDLKLVTKQVSKEFLKNKKNNYSLKRFYTKCDKYLPQLVLYAGNPGRIQSLSKRLRILKFYKVKEIVDIGSGISVDAFVYAHFGIKSVNVEYKNSSRRFAKWLFEKNDLKKYARFISPNKFINSLLSDDKTWRAIQAIEVVAHVEDPYLLFEKAMEKSKIFMWTNDINLHRDKLGGDPQHLPHNLNKVINSLNINGNKLKIEKMAIPPRVWINKKFKMEK